MCSPLCLGLGIQHGFCIHGVMRIAALARFWPGSGAGMSLIFFNPKTLRRYQVMADATKAMHQLDGMDIAGNKIQVKIAALSPLDASLPAAAGAPGAIPGAPQGVDLDDTVEGASVSLLLQPMEDHRIFSWGCEPPRWLERWLLNACSMVHDREGTHLHA